MTDHLTAVSKEYIESGSNAVSVGEQIPFQNCFKFSFEHEDNEQTSDLVT